MEGSLRMTAKAIALLTGVLLLIGTCCLGAAAMQESSLTNTPGGGPDSVGLFQQRPSQGWGTPAQLMDPVYAATQFYTRLLRVPHWQDLPLTVAAQAVQRSAFPDAYAKHE